MKLYHLLAIIPFVGLLGGVLGFANRVTPFVLGLPFLHFWIILWIVLSSLTLVLLNKLDGENEGSESE